MEEVVVYTDGSCLGSPGVGGWACYFIHNRSRWTLAGAKDSTFSGEMELTAIVQALRTFGSRKKLKIYSDCRPIVLNLNLRLDEWNKDGFTNKHLGSMYAEAYELLKEHDVEIFWVKAHAGNKGNEIVDTLARKSAKDLRKVLNQDYIPPKTSKQKRRVLDDGIEG